MGTSRTGVAIWVGCALALGLQSAWAAPAPKQARKPATPSARAPAAAALDAPDYPKMFEYSRALLTRKPVQDFLRDTFKKELELTPELRATLALAEESTKHMSEAQFMLLLEKNPALWDELDGYLQEVPKLDETDEAQKALRKKWRQAFRTALKDTKVKEEFQRINNPVEPYVLGPATPEGGYRNAKLFVNHPRQKGGKALPADDLKQVVKDFIRTAKKQLVLNFFDFDLMDVANELVAAKARGLDVRVGIDKGVIEARPEVAAVHERLKEGGVFVHPVDSVGLNHQKMIAKDWELPGAGKALLSSGNLTQSCIGPEGDMVHLNPRPDFSVPNANHLITLDSDLLSQLIHHELTKTLDPAFQLRGSQYPTTGAYKLFGPKAVDGSQNFLIITFTPGGALENVNRNMIARAIASTEGPVHMAQFAFSSQSVQDALLERARAEVAKHGSFRFLSVGDTPFSVQDWSGFLKMSGLDLQKNAETKKYVELADSPWRQVLGEEGFQALRKNIRIAPPEYGTHRVTIDGKSVEVTGKLHHKMLVTGDVAIMGTSFNFSTGAETNQEQLVLWRDPEMAADGRSVVESLAARSPRSVHEETVRRNSRDDVRVVDDPNVDKPIQRAPAAQSPKKGSKAAKAGTCAATGVGRALSK